MRDRRIGGNRDPVLGHGDVAAVAKYQIPHRRVGQRDVVHHDLVALIELHEPRPRDAVGGGDICVGRSVPCGPVDGGARRLRQLPPARPATKRWRAALAVDGARPDNAGVDSLIRRDQRFIRVVRIIEERDPIFCVIGGTQQGHAFVDLQSDMAGE